MQLLSDVVDAANKTSTNINLNQTGALDESYARQISTAYNTFKLALDFYDDVCCVFFCISNGVICIIERTTLIRFL